MDGQQIQRCEKCGKRPAVIYRRLTRQKLCLQCHYDYLLRIVKRNFNPLKNIPPRTPVFVPLVPWMPLESLLLLKIVVRIERKHGSRTYALLLKEKNEEDPEVDCSSIRASLEKAVGEDVGIVIASGRGVLSGLLSPNLPKLSRWRRLRAVAADTVSRLGGGLIVLPSCMELLAVIELSGYLRAVQYPLGEVKPALSSPLVTGFVNGFYGVPCAETTLHSLIAFGDVSLGRVISGANSFPKKLDIVDETAVGIVFDTVADQSYEVLFSMQKSSLALTRPGRVSSCRLCGGSSAGEVCEWCAAVEEARKGFEVRVCGRG